VNVTLPVGAAAPGRAAFAAPSVVDPSDSVVLRLSPGPQLARLRAGPLEDLEGAIAAYRRDKERASRSLAQSSVGSGVDAWKEFGRRGQMRGGLR